MIAIQTRYLCPTNFRGARIVAEAHKATSAHKALRATMPYHHELSGPAAHFEAVKLLCWKMGWGGKMACGQLGNGDWAWVFIEHERVEHPGGLWELPEPKRED